MLFRSAAAAKFFIVEDDDIAAGKLSDEKLSLVLTVYRAKDFADAKAKVEDKRVKLKEAVDKDDFDAMKSLLEELQQELYALGASVYQQAGAEGAAPGADAAGAAGGSTGDAGDDVIDAEFTESK